MMFSGEETPATVPFCSWCYGVEKLSRCSRCGNAYYCCKEHQVQHWKIHRKDCKASLKTGLSRKGNDVPLPGPQSVTNAVEAVLNVQTNDISPQFTTETQPPYSGWLESNAEGTSQVASDTGELSYPVEQLSPNIFVPSECTLPPGTLQTTALYEANEASNLDNIYAAVASGLEDKIFADSNTDVFSSFSSELLSSTNNYWDLIDNCNTENFSLNYTLDISNLKPANEKVIETSLDNLNFVPTVAASSSEAEKSVVNNNQTSDDNLLLKNICQNIIHDLNEYGICVIDEFLGSKIGDLIAAEVKSMFLTGIFKKGELVHSGIWHSNQNVRGDVITWVDGSETGCHYIDSLIKKLDFLMAACNKMPQNGVLSKYKLNRRTKAMIACYPGDGTHYKKHIDNPDGDGRCITCIYYLNKKWDAQTHGGILRMFPMAHEDEVANIEPIFDRMLFFWSDKRNPHEVLPSYAVRFAITVWYFDSDERDKALQRSKTQKQN